MDCQLFYEEMRDSLNIMVNNGANGHQFPHFDEFDEIEGLIHAYLKAEVAGQRRKVPANADQMIEKTATDSKRSFVEVEGPITHPGDTSPHPPANDNLSERSPAAGQPPSTKRQTSHGDDFSFGDYQGRSNALFKAAESFHESFKASIEQLKHAIDKRSENFMLS